MDEPQEDASFVTIKNLSLHSSHTHTHTHTHTHCFTHKKVQVAPIGSAYYIKGDNV